MEDLVQIGSVYKAHGVKGIMKVRITPEYMDDFLQLEAVFIQGSKSTLPYFVKSSEAIADNMALLQVEEIDSKEQITPLMKAPLLARDEDLSVELDEWESLEGYVIYDKTKGLIGEILEVIEMPQQELARVQYQEREVLIPIHEDLVDEVDEDERKIYINLPEGYFEVF